jgi:transcriptional regulator with XRE-family HTH domain
MKIDEYLTDEAVLAELGERLGRTRLERNLTQRELAAEAGVERKAVQRIEAGEPAKLTSLIRVLRALGLLDGLDRLVPEPLPSPIELLKLHGRSRQRASGKRLHSAPARGQTAPWHWGDERTPAPPGNETTPPSRGAKTPARGETPARGAKTPAQGATPPTRGETPPARPAKATPRRDEPRAATA